MEQFISVIQYIINIVELFSFVFVFMKKEFIRLPSKKIIIFVAAFFCELFFETTGKEILMLFVFIPNFFLLFSAFSVSLKEAVKIYLITLPMISILEFVPYVIISINSDISGNIRNLISTIIIIAFIWFFYIFAGRKLQKDMFGLRGKSWILVSIESFLLFGLIFLYPNTMDEAYKLGEGTLQVILLAIGAISIVIMNLFMLYNVNVKQKYKLEADYLEKRNEQQKEYFELLLEKEKDTRKYRHDVINEIIQMEMFLEKREYDSLKAFMGEMHNDIKKISNNDYNVGNEILNTMLNYYLVPIKEKCHISVEGFLDERIGISQRDMCIVFSNLIKNAREAVERVAISNRIIRVQITDGVNNFSFSIGNSFAPSDENVTTSKQDKKNHGIGLENVRKIINKNGGKYDVKIRDNYYLVTVILKK